MEELLRVVRAFNSARGWRARHTPLQLAISVSVEAAELLERFQWIPDAQSLERMTNPQEREAVASEAADVAIYLLSLCDICGIDLEKAVREKVAINERRFPARAESGDSRGHQSRRSHGE